VKENNLLWVLREVNMGNEFLHKEYELNYEQLRFYDSRQESIFLYLFTLTSSVAAAQFAIYKFFSGATQEFYKCHLFLSVVVFIATVLLYLSMLQNRLYFVFTGIPHMEKAITGKGTASRA